MHDIKAEEIIF